jgi:hypothetical protein
MIPQLLSKPESHQAAAALQSPTPSTLLLHTDTPFTSPKALEALSSLPNLKGLALESVEYAGPQVAALAAHLPGLESLHIRVQGYSHQLHHLGSLTRLTSLHVTCSDASSSAISRAILQLQQLRRLQLSGSIVLQPVLDLVSSCSRLEELQLSQALSYDQVSLSVSHASGQN